MWDRTKEAHRTAGCKLDPFGDGDRHNSKTCPDKKYVAWVRRRPWKKLRDADLLELDDDSAFEYSQAWDDFHTDKGCVQAEDGTWNHTGCDPRDRQDPDTYGRWEQAGKECVARGCWPEGAQEWAHVETCRFWRWASKADAEEAILGRVKHAMENGLPENALKVLRAIADTGLGDDESHTPSVDVMASRSYLVEQTGLSDPQVRRALSWLVNHEYLLLLHNVEDIGLDFMRRNAKRLRREGPGRPANWYRVLPPPKPVEPMRPSGRLDKLLTAAG